MKVYILQGYDIEGSEIIDVFDSLEQAQSYEGSKPEDWTSDINSRGWWERTIFFDGFGPKFVSITEWDVKTNKKLVDQDEQEQTYCVSCHHPIDIHSKYGCNYNHKEPNYVEIGCTCPIQNRIHY